MKRSGVILGAIMFVVWGGDAWADPNPAAANGPQIVEVFPLWVRNLPGGGVRGECFPVKITVDRAGETPFRISFVETEVGASGSDWRAAGWMAAVVAAQMLNYDPRSTHVSFDVAGSVDGPSPGGLLTVGIIAATRGDRIRPDAAMTGTINPDGTIGLVGGIPQKIMGAAKAGKKLVIIPEGVRIATDLEKKEEVDLFELGDRLGVEVKPVLDIFSAYRELTGQELVRPASAGHPRQARKMEDRSLEKMREWLTRYDTTLKQYENLPEDARYEYTEECAARARSLAERAGRLHREGQATAALWDAIMASVNASYALEAGQTQDTFQTHGWEKAVARVRDTLGVEGQLDLVAEQFKRFQPKTLDQAGMYLNAYGPLLEAFSYHLMARDLLTKLKPDDEGSDSNLWVAAEKEQVALADIALARGALEVAGQLGGPPIPEGAPLERLAEFYRLAGNANLQVFESGFVDKMANNIGVRREEARLGIAAKDEFYASTNVSRNVATGLESFLGEGPQLRYARLAAGLDQYVRSATLWAKYDSLGVTLDEDFAITGVAREKSLQNALDWAEDEARRGIRMLQDHGVDATACVDTYQIARLMRERNLQEKFDALQWFWTAHVTSRVLIHLGGFDSQSGSAAKGAGAGTDASQPDEAAK
ncbi:MAG: S16 family serine protease [Verrucomicrobiales bacterium]